jgi:hypothetical protein
MGEQEPSCYHQLWISRKNLKKVTPTIFPNETSEFSRSDQKNEINPAIILLSLCEKQCFTAHTY